MGWRLRLRRRSRRRGCEPLGCMFVVGSECHNLFLQSRVPEERSRQAVSPRARRASSPPRARSRTPSGSSHPRRAAPPAPRAAEPSPAGSLARSPPAANIVLSFAWPNVLDRFLQTTLLSKAKCGAGTGAGTGWWRRSYASPALLRLEESVRALASAGSSESACGPGPCAATMTNTSTCRHRHARRLSEAQPSTCQKMGKLALPSRSSYI